MIFQTSYCNDLNICFFILILICFEYSNLNIQGSLSNAGECQLAVEVAETVQQLTRANPVSIGR